MKKINLKSTALLALAGFTLLTTAAHAAHEGDLFLGVRATGGIGATKDYLINLGPASQFEGGSQTTLNLGNVGADLGVLFGSGAGDGTAWYNRADVLWGIAGTTGANALTSPPTPGKTLYVTNPTSSPWLRDGATGQGGTSTLMVAMSTAYDTASISATSITIPGSPPTLYTLAGTNARVQDSNAANSWVSYTPDGPNSGNAHIAFGAFNSSIEGSFANGATQSVLTLYRLSPDNGGGAFGAPGDLLGRVFLNNNGQLTFVPTAAVGTGSFAFANASPTVAENNGPLSVNIVRSGDPTTAASVTLSTANGTAIAGTDYTAIPGQVVNFAVGETQKTVEVTIANRNGVIGDRNFTLHLSSPSSGFTAGGDATATITPEVLPSVIQLASATFSADEISTSVEIGLTRTGGTSPVDVQISTTADTAHAGTDYTAVTNETVSFAFNATTATKTILLSHPVGNTANKKFTVTLSNPSINASIGSPSTGTVTILATDNLAPTVTISNPAAGATLTASSVIISGTAKDNIEVDKVLVFLNDNAAVEATLSPSSPLNGTPWSFTPSAIPGGFNTVQVIAKDKVGNTSAMVTRSFTLVKKGSIVVSASAGGTVTGLVAGATAYQVGKSYKLTAKPAAGFVFDHWVVPGIAPGTASLQTPILSFVYSDTLLTNHTIQALFVATPYIATKIGSFNGLVTPHKSSGPGDLVPAAVPSNSTSGFVNVVVSSAGTFTGTLKIDGLSLGFSGLFDLTGTARFGANRDDKILVARTTKPAVELMLHLDLAGTSAQITGTVKQYQRTTLISTSDVLADRAHFDAKNVTLTATHSTYLANKGAYTVVIPAKAQTNGLTSSDFPQGAGFGTITVGANGVLTVSLTLADSTAVVTTAVLSKDLKAPLYLQLYTAKAGSFSALISLDDQAAGTDLKATNTSWFRPWSNTQYYPWGWDEGVTLDLFGAKYQSTGLATSVLPRLTGVPSPNAVLTFTEGSLAGPVTKQVNVSTTNVVTKFAATDKSFNLTLTAASGKIAGTFPHSNGTTPAFQGIIYQKAGAAEVAPGGHGYFLTTAVKPVNGLGESGNVTLTPSAQ